MTGKKVIYNNKTYIVIYDYGNGKIEIKKENSMYDVELVKKAEIHIINE